MANNTTHVSRKKPVSQKRVAIVLASLVGTMTLSAGSLLLMESNSPLVGASPYQAAAIGSSEVKSLLRTRAGVQGGAWQYVVIYESGDSEANAGSLAEGKVRGAMGMRTRANFHFVVDSAASKSGGDGVLEVGNAWLDQVVGTPHQGWPDNRYHQLPSYKNAIGVCVAGDLSKQLYSDAQNYTLIQLARELQQLNIPKEKVLFQWELTGAASASSAQREYAAAFRRALK